MLTPIFPESVKPKEKPAGLEVHRTQSTADDLKLPHEPLEFDAVEIQLFPHLPVEVSTQLPDAKRGRD